MRDNGIRIVVIVSSDPSDLYFANQMARQFDLAGILLEHQREPPDSRPRWEKALVLLHRPRELLTRSMGFLGWHVHRWICRSLLNEQPADFGEDGHRLDPSIDSPILRVEGKGQLNHPKHVAWIHQCEPDLIVVCGASLLKPPILEIPTLGTLNLHGGLSQFYRGLFTTDWAIHNWEPEKVGATVHFVTSGIDDGRVVFQGRPRLNRSDHPNKAYEKVVKLGVEMMSEAIRALDAGQLHPALVAPRGQLYRKRDFTNLVKRRLWHRWKKAMRRYDEGREQLDASVDAQLLNPFPLPASGDSRRANQQSRGRVR